MWHVTPENAEFASGAKGDWSPVIGPADRRSFFEEQRRNRRASWRMTALCVAAIAVMGIPISIVVSPLVYAGALIGWDVANLFHRLPDPMYSFTHETAAESYAKAHRTRAQVVRTNTMFAIALVAPGAVVLAGLWLLVRRIFLRSGAGALLLSMGAREPRSGDLEEQQLANLIGEMAIAAGVKPPRVMLLDLPIRNAAAVGNSLDDSTIVVARGLLDNLNRDETQAIIGHLLASVGNGDLRFSLDMLSVFQTIGLLSVMLQTPFGGKSRGTLVQLFRFLFRGKAHSQEAEQMRDVLLGALKHQAGDDIDIYTTSSGNKTTWRDVVKLPFLIAYLAVWLTQTILLNMTVVPLMALLWKARRYLADASAVQLTRNPTALACAIRNMGFPSTAGNRWTTVLFATGSTRKGAEIADFFPEPARRVRRLRLQGADVEELPPTRMEQWMVKLRTGTRGQIAARVGIISVLAGIGLMICSMLLVCVVLITCVAMAIDGLFLGPAVMIVHVILRHFGN